MLKVLILFSHCLVKCLLLTTTRWQYLPNGGIASVAVLKKLYCVYMVKEMTHLDVQRHNTHVVTVFFVVELPVIFLSVHCTCEYDVNLEGVSAGQIFSVMGH